MFADVLLPLALVLIMSSLGLTLTPADFRRVVTAPRGVGIGLVNLLAISPLLAFGVARSTGSRRRWRSASCCSVPLRAARRRTCSRTSRAGTLRCRSR